MELDVCAIISVSLFLIALLVFALTRIAQLQRAAEQNELHLLKLHDALLQAQREHSTRLRSVESHLRALSAQPNATPTHTSAEPQPSAEPQTTAELQTTADNPPAREAAAATTHTQHPPTPQHATHTQPAQHQPTPKTPPTTKTPQQTQPPTQNTQPSPTKKHTKTPSRPKSLEHNLGGTLAVWGGAGALALAGALWMQYSIENNLISPLARCLLAVVVALAMAGIAEWISKRIRLVSGGLFAASIAVLYATFTAAHNLYDLLSAPVCAILLCATTAGAVFTSLRHNLKIIASIGLLGGFLTPVLVGAHSTSPLFSLGYILLLNCSVAFIAWKRSWSFLVHIALLFTFISELGQLVADSSTTPNITLLLIGLLSAPFALSLHLGFSKDSPTDDTNQGDNDPKPLSKPPHILAWLSLHASLFLPLFVGLLVGLRWGHTPYLWVQQGILLTLTFTMSFLKDQYRILPFGAALLVLVHQLIHIGTQDPSGAHTVTLGLIFSLLTMAGFAAIIWRRPHTVSEPVALSLIAKIILAVFFLYSPSRMLFAHWGIVPIGIAILQGGFFAALHNRYKTHEPRPISLTILPISIASLIATAAWMQFEGASFSIALSAEAIALGVLSKRTQDRALSITGHIFSGIAFAYLLPLPRTWIFTSTTESTPFFNTMGLSYLILAGGFLLLSMTWRTPLSPNTPKRDTTHTTISRVYGLSATALVLILSTLTVRHIFHPDWTGNIQQSEHLSYSLSWASVGVGALVTGLVLKSKLARLVSLALILTTTLKVFLFDLSNLEGVGRVISVAALGVVLIVIATLYRLFVLPPDEDEEQDTTEPPLDDSTQPQHTQPTAGAELEDTPNEKPQLDEDQPIELPAEEANPPEPEELEQTTKQDKEPTTDPAE